MFTIFGGKVAHGPRKKILYFGDNSYDYAKVTVRAGEVRDTVFA